MINSVSDRHRYVMDQIRARKEMAIDICMTEFTEQSPFPEKDNWLRIWLSLYRMDIPFISSFSRKKFGSHIACNNADISPGFRCLYGNIVCDDGVALGDTFFADYANIFIGRGTGFSYQNIVITSTHDLCNMKTVLAREIIIGENVWITSGVVILNGVKIGHNSVIGAGSVVSRDIPPNVLAVGNPAKPVKTINRGPLYQKQSIKPYLDTETGF